jgi:hypothetical protein
VVTISIEAVVYEQVLPVLIEYGYPATVLVSPKKVGTVSDVGEKSIQYLTWDALQKISKQNVTVGTYEDAALNFNSIAESLVREPWECFVHRSLSRSFYSD